MMYQLVLDQLHTKQELVNLLPSIGALLDTGTSINSTHMNSQQVFSQLYQSVTKARTQQQPNRLQLLSTIEHQDEQEDSEDEIEAEEQEDNDWDGEEDIEGEKG